MAGVKVIGREQRSAVSRAREQAEGSDKLQAASLKLGAASREHAEAGLPQQQQQQRCLAP